MHGGDIQPNRLVSNLLFADLITYFDAGGEPGRVVRLLEHAGETRSIAELTDQSGWSTYEQCRRLLEGALEVLGSFDALTKAVMRTATEGGRHRVWHRFQGAKSTMWEDSMAMMRLLLPHEESELEEVGPDEWVMSSRIVGQEPYRALCAWRLAARSYSPVANGHPVATVTETACQCDGAPACVLRIQWNRDEVSQLAAQLDFLRANAHASDTRFDLLSSTVGELFSADALEEVLPRILEATAQSVIASSIVLAVEPGFAPRAVFGVGAPQAELEHLAQQLFDGQALSEPSLAMEVSSSRASYGWLLAVRPLVGEMGAVHADALRTYARLAAAALDSAGSLHEARHQAATAQALLRLSSSLSGGLSLDDASSRVTRAVGQLVDCDSASLYLIDDEHLVPVAHEWIGGTVARSVGRRGRPLSEIHGPIDQPVSFEAATADPQTAAMLAAVGWAAAVCIPIVAGGEQLGALVAAVGTDPRRLVDRPEVVERLTGLAGQAGIAVANARLLEQVRHQALHDSLTGLPNRALIMDRTEQMLARARREDLRVGALFVDLDHFKDINDTLGHEAGDQVLQVVASRLASALRHTDTVARLGGDEFVVLVEAFSPAFGPEAAAERVLAVLRQPIVIDAAPAPIMITASVGVAIGERADAGELLRDADIALYQAKLQGRDRSVVFHRQMQEARAERHQLEHDLRVAVGRDELFLAFQPTFDLGSGVITGVEALVRWEHPTRGVVAPDDFIPVAEEVGLIVPIGRWVLREACRQTARWHAMGHRIRVAVNVSARQIDDPGFLLGLQGELAASGLEPVWLTLEITETTLMRDTDATMDHLRKIKATGVRIAIDDFGTGYSSLAYLQQFPVDSLKIDRSFVSSMSSSPESTALIHTLVQLGKSLGIETLAEGIEQPHQLIQLQQEHCDSGQGFLFARPLLPDQVTELLEAQLARSAAVS